METKKYNKGIDNGIFPNVHGETMNPKRMRIKANGKDMAKKHNFRRDGTVVDMKCAMPVGNGDFGATVHGMPDDYHIRIAKNDLWWDDYPTKKSYVSYGIDGIREKLLNGDVSVNGDVQTASTTFERGPVQTCAAKLTLHLLSGACFSNVREQLDISEGIASTYFNSSSAGGEFCGDFSINTYFGRTNDVMTTWIDTCRSREKSIGFVRMELNRPAFEPYDPTPENAIENQIEEYDKYYQAEPFADGEYWGFTVRLRRGEDPNSSPDFHYTVMCSVTSDKFKAIPALHSVIVEGRPKGDFLIFTTVVSSNDAEDTVAEAKRRLRRVNSPGLPNREYDSTGAWWRYFWNRSWIKLPENYAGAWYWGLYEAASARCPGKACPGYLAPWHSQNYGNWGTHIFTYEETKSNLGLFATNHCDLIEPWVAFLHRVQDKVRDFTSDFYKLPGTCYPHSVSNDGNFASSGPVFNSTMMNTFTTGEALKSVWEYYEFTKDNDYLRDVAYPLLREGAVFYDAYLLDEGDRKVIFPSRIMEYHGEQHSLDNFMKNSISAVSMYRFVLNSAALAAEILGVDEENRENWRKSAKALGDYATYPNGVWKPSEDWCDRTVDYGVSAVSDLSPIAYTGEVDAWHGASAEQIEAGRKTVSELTRDDLIGWEISFRMISNMRYGNRDAASKVLPKLRNIQGGGNLDLYNPSEDFYVDKGAAYLSEVITEMLLQSQSGEIRVFPAYPFEMGDAAFFSLRARNAFLVSSEVRDGKIAYIIIKSLCGEICRVYNELGDDVQVRNLETDEIIAVQPDGRGVIEFATAVENEYVVESKAKPLESFDILNA